MRVSKIKINGKEYTACYSMLVHLDINNEYGNVRAVYTQLGSEKATLLLLEKIVNAGAKYDKLNGIEPEQLPDFEALKDLIGLDDMQYFDEKITDCIIGGKKTEIEAVSKNAETTETEN